MAVVELAKNKRSIGQLQSDQRWGKRELGRKLPTQSQMHPHGTPRQTFRILNFRLGSF